LFIFNKPKAILADLIPEGYVDIHSHLLPGIDDGAKTNEDTVQLMQTLNSYGFSEFITTPHVLTGMYNNTRHGILKTEETTYKHLHLNSISRPLKAAAEYILDETFVELFKKEPLLTLKDNYVLVEMSYLNPPIQLYEILFELQLAGYKPVLAHPERYLFYHQNFEEYKKLKKAGCLFQINLLSVTGYYGKPVLDICKKLLDNNLIDYTGSDVHHERHAQSFKNKILLKKHDALLAALNNNSFFKLSS
jgi:tyrosine-protein phosphatase YwqE